MVEQSNTRCPCAHCRVAGTMGPLILITLGVILLLGQYTRYGLADLFPFLLIVPGIILVIQSFASKTGHFPS
jgi:hypothetical protein